MAKSGGVESIIPESEYPQGRSAVFNIKGNDFRLVARIQYQAGVIGDSLLRQRMPSTTKSMRRLCDGRNADFDR